MQDVMQEAWLDIECWCGHDGSEHHLDGSCAACGCLRFRPNDNVADSEALQPAVKQIEGK